MTYDPRKAGCRCDECPLNGQQVVAPEGNAAARMAIVHETPGADALKFEKQWIGPAGAKLNELLFKAGMSRQQLWLTSALLCRPEVPEESGRRRYDTKEYMAWLRRENVKIKRHNKANAKLGIGAVPELKSPFDCCAPRLQAELAYLDAQAKAAGAPNGLVVVPMGSYVLGGLTTKPSATQSILKYRGSVIFPKAAP